MSLNPFDDIIKQKADGHEAPVPKDAWDNIVKKKRRKPYPVFWWSLSSLLIIAGLFALIHFNKEGVSSTPASKNNYAVEKSAGKDGSPVNINNNDVTNLDNSIQGKEKEDGHHNNNGTSLNDTAIIANTNSNNIKDGKPNPNNTGSNNAQKSLTTTLPDSYAADNSTQQHITASDQAESTRKNKKLTGNKNGSARFVIKSADVDDEEIISNTGPGGKKDTRRKAIAEKEDKDIEVDNNVDPEPSSDKKIVSMKPVPGTGNVVIKDSVQKERTDSSSVLTHKEDPKGNRKAQDTTKSNKTPGFTIEFSGMPVFPIQSYNNDIAIKRSVVGANYREDYTANTVHTTIEPAVAFSLAVSKRINNKVRIGIGLQYLQLKEEIKLSGEETHTTYTEIDRLVNGSLVKDTVETITKGTRTIDAINSYKTYSIPLFMRYSAVNNCSWGIDINAGLYFNISSRYHNSINGVLEPVYNDVMQQPGNKTSTGVDLLAGIRLSRKLHNHFLLFTEPCMRFNLNEYELENSVINKKIHQAGIAFGIAYSIK